jgi:uncharacterized membrane protein
MLSLAVRKEGQMNKFAVVVFDDEAKAYEGVRALQQLHDEGSITLYGTVVVARDAKGSLDVKRRSDDGPLGTAVGSLAGLLIGALGGPVGAVVGLWAGGLVGVGGDIVRSDVSEEFVEDVEKQLEPGKFAVIAELAEEWVAPLDTRMGQLGGSIVREARQSFTDELVEKHADARKAELADSKARRAGEKAERMQADLSSEVEQIQKKLERTAEKARQKLDERKQELQAKLEALEAQAKKAPPETQERVQQRITELRADFGERERKLNRAYELAQEALQS